MKYANSTSHRKGRELVESLGLKDDILAAIEAPDLKVVEGGSAAIKEHIAKALARKGWASPVAVEPTLDLEINACRNRCLLHVQTGNIARAFYDLMKMQSIFDQKRADVAVLIVPTKVASRIIGGNLAQFERISQELELAFFHQVGMPVWLVAFE